MNNTWKIFLTFLILFSYFGVWTGFNENSRLDLTRSIVDESTLDIDAYANNTGDRAFYNGHYYTDKMPGSSLFSVPSYFIWKSIYNLFPEDFKENNKKTDDFVINNIRDTKIYTQRNPGGFILSYMFIGIVSISSLFGALLGVLIYKFSGLFLQNNNQKILITILLTLGTGIFSYSLLFNGVILSALLSFLSFYLIYTTIYSKQKYVNSLTAGILIGIATIIDTTSGILIPMYFVWILIKKKELAIKFITGSIIGISPLLIYNFSILGNPFELIRNHLDPNLYPNYLIGNSGFIYSPTIFKIYKILFGVYRGFFYYSPILIFGIIGSLIYYRKYKIELLMIMSSTLILAIILSTRYDWWGGSVFGSRFLTILSPLFTFPIILLFKKIIKYKEMLYMFILVSIVSVLISFIGLQNTETIILSESDVDIAKKYRNIENTFESLPNPLSLNYLPQFIEYGPRSRIFEAITNGHLDIRGDPLSINYEFGPENYYFFIPFLSLIPLIIITLYIWKNNLINSWRKRPIWKKLKF